MRAIWSGTSRSTTQVDRATGRPNVYRLVAYDNGQATCTCKAFLFYGLRNQDLSEDQKLRYRCKHLVQAYDSGAIPGQPGQDPGRAASETSPPVGGPPVGSPDTLRASVPTMPGAAPDPDDDDEYDDDEYVAPQVRR